MNYPENVLQVLKKYRILKPDGTWRTSVLQSPPSSPLGPGPILAEDVIKRLVAADSTPDGKWLDWIFYQAAGGEKGEQMREGAISQIRERFIDERKYGFQHPDTKEYVPPVSAEAATARWNAMEPKFRDIMYVCDQDSVTKLNTFGYYRNWPGSDRIYENVVSAVTNYQARFKKLLRMNKEMAKEDKPPLPIDPADIKTVEEMVNITKKVERYFGSKKAREDIQLSNHGERQDGLIYADDYVEVLVPLTWAAAVYYGYDQWAWANREQFDTFISSEDAPDYKNEWKQRTTGGKVYVYITFRVPAPVWVSRKNGKFNWHELTSLALELNTAEMRKLATTNPDTWKVWDEENRNTMTIRDVKQMLLDEPTRQDPQDDELPIRRGANVYKTPEEAQAVVQHLDMALKAIVDWSAKFDPKTVKQDAMALD